MNTSPVRENVIDLHRRECACGCGHFTSGYKYIGSPGSTDYNRHAARYSRQKRANKKLNLENAILELVETVKLTQIDSKQDPGVNIMILQELQKLNNNISSRPAATETPAHTTRAPSSPAANLDDVELEIKQAGTDKDNMSNYNFMIASAINVYGNFDSLPPEIIEYGVRTGRIPPDAVKQKVMETVHVPLGGTQPRHTGGPKQMDVPQFDAPAFDDDADLLEMM